MNLADPMYLFMTLAFGQFNVALHIIIILIVIATITSLYWDGFGYGAQTSMKINTKIY